MRGSKFVSFAIIMISLVAQIFPPVNSAAAESRTVKIIKNANGSSIETKDDGTEIITNANGSSVETRRDGTEIVKNADGSSVQTNPDGSQLVTNLDGSQALTKK